MACAPSPPPPPSPSLDRKDGDIMLVKTEAHATITTTTTIVTDAQPSPDNKAHVINRVHHHHHHQKTTTATVTVAHFDQIPPWMQCDPYIKHGYRVPQDSVAACVRSLFYPHNELVNVWSHLLPACFFLSQLFVSDFPLFARGTVAAAVEGGPMKEGVVVVADVAVLHVYICGTTLCLYFSTLYHGLSAHSQDVALRFLKLDYLGIVLTISTTCVSATYFGLYGQARLQAFYMGVTALCAAGVFWAVLDPRADGPRAAAWRAAIFTALAFSGGAPIVHVALVQGSQGLENFPLLNIFVTCASYTVGTAMYVTRWPEKRWPGIFDLWGSSHQWFHILVAFGQIVHLMGLRDKLLLHNPGALNILSPS